MLGLQALAVHWTPAQAVFGTVDLSTAEWSVSVLVASTTLLLEEGRKGLLRLLARNRSNSGAAGEGGGD